MKLFLKKMSLVASYHNKGGLQHKRIKNTTIKKPSIEGFLHNSNLAITILYQFGSFHNQLQQSYLWLHQLPL